MEEGSSPHRSLLSRFVGAFKKESFTSSIFENEISTLLSHGETAGTISANISTMIQNIVDFNDTVARQIMTPRIDMVAIDRNCPLAEVIKILTSEGLSRLPVYADDMDHIIGFIVGKDLLQFLGADLNKPIPTKIIRPITLVHGNKKIGDILSLLRHQKTHMAMVLDEYGGTAGLVTMEDIIEEIVGDIHDESDEEDLPIEEISPHVILATGQATVSDLDEHLDVELPEGDYDTLGGFLTHQLGRVPQVGEQIVWEDLTFLVLVADDRKVERVEIRRGAVAATKINEE